MHDSDHGDDATDATPGPDSEGGASGGRSAELYAALHGDAADTGSSSRRLAESIRRAAENGPRLAADNRAWVLRVTEYAAGQGISQIIDLGCGLPAHPNVHEVAQAIDPKARVVYVDNDDAVLARGRTVLETDGTIYRHSDITRTAEVLEAVRGHLDLSRPAAIILGSVLHLVRTDDPGALVRAYAGALAPGSLLAVSHVASEGGVTPEQADVIREAYAGALTVRTFETVRALFGGLELVPPGLVDVHAWPTADGRETGERTALRVLAGVARL
ncbi:SAM-dependent methyltransferase [Actinocorallia aurea]